MLNQDLHIHTVFSSEDSAVVEQQTLELIHYIRHAKVIGISDHFENFMPHRYNEYKNAVKSQGFKVGTEVNGSEYVRQAADFEFDYYVYHCWNKNADYEGIDVLLKTGRPVIIAHPYALETDLDRVPAECFVEINNRYIWRFDWKKSLAGYKNKFRFILSSDAHQPHWLNQTIAKKVADEVEIEEHIIFK